MIFILLIFLIGYPIVDAFGDSYVELNKKVNHNINTIKYGLILFLLAFMTQLKLYVNGWDEAVELMIIGVTLRWHLFDGFYNLFRHRNWFSPGITSKIDMESGNIIIWCIKWGLVFISILFTAQWFYRI